MSGWWQAIPAVLSAFGGVQGDKAQAQELERQGRIARAQADRDEATKRRENRDFLNTQAAAFAEHGQIGGSADLIARQSAVLAELDALNIRYGGQTRQEQSRRQAQAIKSQTGLLAGARLISGASSVYTSNKMLSNS
jgi:hypothetical protein